MRLVVLFTFRPSWLLIPVFRIWDQNSSVQHVQEPFNKVEDIESLMPVWPTSMQVPLLKKRRFSEKQVLCMRPSSCSVATQDKETQDFRRLTEKVFGFSMIF